MSKLYLPAWSGGGTAYDDEVPPPEATVTVAGRDLDPVTGWSWARIGQQSRAFHRTQGMGAWVQPGDERDYPLHLAASRVGSDARCVGDNLPGSLADLGLADVAAAIADVLAAFPDHQAVATAAASALRLVRDGAGCVADQDRHRVARVQAQLARVLRLAAGIEARARILPDALLPGQEATVQTKSRAGLATGLRLTPVLPDGWSAGAGRFALPTTPGRPTPSPSTPTRSTRRFPPST